MANFSLSPLQFLCLILGETEGEKKEKDSEKERKKEKEFVRFCIWRGRVGWWEVTGSLVVANQEASRVDSQEGR